MWRGWGEFTLLLEDFEADSSSDMIFMIDGAHISRIQVLYAT